MAVSRTVLVTGASRGIGRAAAMALLAAGNNVAATARTIGGLDALKADCAGQANRLSLHACEMSAPEDVARTVGEAEARFGGLDGVFGNAGILGLKTPMGTLAPKDFDFALAVNLAANYHLLRLCDRLLRASPAGRALFVTSGVAWKRHAGWTCYAVTKAALEALVGVYANEVAGTAVRANLISPGPIRTEMRIEAWPGEDSATVPPPEALAPHIVRMLSPDFAENGVIYDFKAGMLVRNVPPR